MTGLLSADSAGEIRAFSGTREPVPPTVHPLEALCATLRGELDEARAALADVRREGERAVEAARSEGRRDGLAQAESREEERLAALGEVLEGAIRNIDAKLADLDRLAAELASVALERLLDDPAAMRTASTSFIVRQVRDLRRSRLIRAQVSAHDFEDEESLTALGARMRDGSGDIELIRDAGLQSGQAKLDFALGHADLDFTSQLQSFAALLRNMARE